jgi:hypothetical protein
MIILDVCYDKENGEGHKPSPPMRLIRAREEMGHMTKSFRTYMVVRGCISLVTLVMMMKLATLFI